MDGVFIKEEIVIKPEISVEMDEDDDNGIPCNLNIVATTLSTKKTARRKQELKPMNDEEDFQLKGKNTKKKTQPPPLYSLDPDDFPNNPKMQKQIVSAQKIHGYHMKQKRIVQALAADNRKLRKLIAFYQKREQLVSCICNCTEVKKALKGRAPPFDLPPEIEIPGAYRFP